MQKTIVLSLGGSLIVPDKIDINFLKSFKKIIEKYVNKGCKFVIICGGGKTARDFQHYASKLSRLSNEELDWLGIYATRMNAQLVRSLFKDNSNDEIIQDPTAKINFKKNIVIAAGWKPGWSTDYDAVLLAKNLRLNEVINMSNVGYVYDKNPKERSDAKKIERISWNDFRKLSGTKWKAGMNMPFDPIAAKEAQKSGITVNVIGKDLKNLEKLLEGKKFRGTIIK